MRHDVENDNHNRKLFKTEKDAKRRDKDVIYILIIHSKRQNYYIRQTQNCVNARSYSDFCCYARVDLLHIFVLAAGLPQSDHQSDHHCRGSILTAYIMNTESFQKLFVSCFCQIPHPQ